MSRRAASLGSAACPGVLNNFALNDKIVLCDKPASRPMTNFYHFSQYSYKYFICAISEYPVIIELL
jgi:hypothetical protein